MLTKLDSKTVQSSEGFLVRVPDIHKVVYTEGKRLISIEIEGGLASSGEVDWIVYDKTLQAWDPPFENEVISHNDRKNILTRVSQCLEILGMPHRIV